MLISISQYECPCIFCNQCTQRFSLFLLFQFRRPHHRQAAQHLKIRYLKKLKWCDAQSYEECLQLLLHQLEWLMLLHDMCPEYFYVNDPLYTCKRLSWDHFHIYQSRLDFYQIFTQTHPQVQGFQSTASTAILKISQLIIDYKNQDRSIQLLDEYSKMGNQVCISQEAQNSTSIKTTDKKEQLNSITQAQKSSACANSESIYFENLQEMDEGSPASKFDIKFLRTNVRASNRKHADISFSSTQPQFTKKKAKYFHTKNHTEQTKKFLQQWQIDYLQFAMKLDTEKSTERKKLIAIKSYSNFITRKQNNFIEMKISGQNFYKLRHQSIVPYYQINKKIGQGSFGSVYKGKCLKTGQMRAIKILKKKIMNQLDQKTLISEINILKKMDHINIIKLYDVFFHKNFFYVVTQYCQGGSLLEALQKQLLKSQKQVAVIVRQLVSAVSYMHKLKIAHRDLKLDNIVLVKQITQATKNNISIKLIDFGLAQAVEYDYKNKTGLVGTVSYMAPQIFTGFYSLKSDVWSCGIILCMLLIGYNPFKKKKQNLTMKSIECQQISFVSMDWAKVSLKARNLIGQMLTKTPEKRISIDHVLNHDWLRSLTLRQTKEIITSDYRSEFVISNFNNYNRGSNFICYIKNFLISRQLTQTTRQQMALIFQKIDTDSSGVIDRQELIELYNLVTGITNEEIERLIQKIDQNKSGKIDFQQFLICMTHNQILRNKECINEAFDFLDQDKTGYIEKEQLFQCLDGCEQQEVVRVIKQADFNGDGKISRQQFTSYLMKVQL